MEIIAPTEIAFNRFTTSNILFFSKLNRLSSFYLYQLTGINSFHSWVGSGYFVLYKRYSNFFMIRLGHELSWKIINILQLKLVITWCHRLTSCLKYAFISIKYVRIVHMCSGCNNEVEQDKVFNSFDIISVLVFTTCNKNNRLSEILKY